MDRNALCAGVLPRAHQYAQWKARGNRQLTDHLLDAATEAVVRALNNYNPERGPFGPYAMSYVSKAVASECRRFLTRQEERPGLLSFHLDPDLTYDPPASTRQSAPEVPISIELLDLPDRLREPVLLYFIHGYTFDEIGNLLGISERTVRGRIELAAYELAPMGAVRVKHRGKRFKRG